MSPVNVGLLGHNGLVGGYTLKALAALQQAGKANVVVIHRPSAATSTIPSGVEARALDLTKPDGPDFDAAVAGLDVLVSTVGGAGILDQKAILPALSRSKTLKTFIPSDFGASWRDDELKALNVPFLQQKEEVVHKAKELGVPITAVRNGIISDFVFQFPIQWNAKENQVFVYRDSQKVAIPFTSSAYIAAAIANLVQRPLDTIANKQFYAVELEHTGQEVSDIISRLHGKEPTVIPVDDEKISAGVHDANPFVALGSGILRKAGRNWWDFPEERVVVEGWESKGLEYELKKVIS